MDVAVEAVDDVELDVKRPSRTVIDMLHSYANPQYLVTDVQLDEIRHQRDDADVQRQKKDERKKLAAKRKQEREEATKALTASIIETAAVHQKHQQIQDTENKKVKGTDVVVNIVPKAVAVVPLAPPKPPKPVTTPPKPVTTPPKPVTTPPKPVTTPLIETGLYDFSNLLDDSDAVTASPWAARVYDLPTEVHLKPDAVAVEAVRIQEEKRKKQLEVTATEERDRRRRHRYRREQEEAEVAAETAERERNDHRRRRKEREKKEAEAEEEKEQRAKELHRWRKKIKTKKALTQKQFGIALGCASSAIETSAEFLGSRYARLTNLSRNVEKALLAGDFDDSIEQVSASPAAVAVLENPMVSFGTTFASILVDTHLENSRKSLSTSVNEFRGRVQVTRSEMEQFHEWQRFKQQEQASSTSPPSYVVKSSPQRNSIGKDSVQQHIDEKKKKNQNKRHPFGADINSSKDAMQTVRTNMQRMQPMISSMSSAASMWSGDTEPNKVDDEDDINGLQFA